MLLRRPRTSGDRSEGDIRSKVVGVVSRETSRHAPDQLPTGAPPSSPGIALVPYTVGKRDQNKNRCIAGGTNAFYPAKFAK